MTLPTRPSLALLLALAMPFSFGARALAQTKERVADSLMAPYASPTGPGASLLVVHDGAIVYQHGYGLADVDGRVPVTPATNFRLASLSKQFTATAVMLLVADGRLHYDDDITSIVPGLPRFAHGVTVRHLLTHTGGLPDYEDFVPDTQVAQVHDRDIPALISRADSAKFRPGIRYDYSNTGYGLLALIVEHRSGERYADFLRRHIFAPLGMSGTVAFEEGRSTVRHRAYGHTVSPSGTTRTDQSNTSAVLGDGGIYSSAVDLARWDAAIEHHTLVSKAAQTLAWSPPMLASGVRSEYGFGWFVDHDAGRLRLRHHGESRGFTNGIIRYPDQRLTVVVLTNRSGGAPWDVAQQIADLYLGEARQGAAAPWRP